MLKSVLTVGLFCFTNLCWSQTVIPVSIQTSFGSEFLELTEEQEKQIKAVFVQYKQNLYELESQKVGSQVIPRQVFDELIQERDKDLRKILHAHQIELLEAFPLFISISREGFANSVANGVISLHLELTDNERARIQEVAKNVRSEFVEAVAKAQEDAIGKILDELPKAKREKLERLVEPLKQKNGSIWDIPDFHFRTEGMGPTTVIRKEK